METSLHQQLKRLYASDQARTEVVVDGFRIDAVADDGELIEIQHASLGALRDKTRQLLPPRGKHRLRIVKPIVARKRITTLTRPGGEVVRSRMSPKSCDWLELFMDLVHFSTVFPRPRLTLEAILIEAEELRVDRTPKRRRGKPYKTLDLRLIEAGQSIQLRTINDLIRQLPLEQLPRQFDTAELAGALQRPRWFAQKVAYCLRTMGGIRSAARRGNAHVYQLRSSRRGKAA